MDFNTLTDDFADSILRGSMTLDEVREQLIDSKDKETVEEGEVLLGLVAVKVYTRL